MKRKWWKEAVFYQIYPRSFLDTNGDGIGDLRGIAEKLDYIKDLGVDVIWLCPIYASPNIDSGYDVSDYRAIMPEFGSMSEMMALIDAVHEKGLRIILDMVVNHTSSKHPWFQAALANKDDPKRDYYIWRQGREGREPNNWRSYFTESAWELDEKSGEYYLHLFAREQPDLNWRNPRLRAEIYEMMRWWLDKGVDGFRLDVINFLAKAPGLPDAEPASERYVFDKSLYANQPGIHEILQEMNREVFSRYDIVTIGETPAVTPVIGADYVNESRKELNMIFQFEIVNMKQWNLVEFKRIWGRWYEALKGHGWNSIYLSNHDQPRQVSRFGNDREYWRESAKLLATLTLTLPGSPFIYQGEEIGMTNVAFPTIDDYRDIATINKYMEAVGRGLSPHEVLSALRPTSRDNARTPMQWNAGDNAGFSDSHPWIGVNPNYRDINVEQQQGDPDSVLAYYKKLIAFRKANQTLIYGDYLPLHEDDPDIYVYERRAEGGSFLIILNFSDRYRMFYPAFRHQKKELILTNYSQAEMDPPEMIKLRPWEARIYRLNRK